MKRTTIFLPEALERDLHGEARRAGKPVASLVREALTEYLVSRRAVGGVALSFVGCAAGTRTDVAERHEELLWQASDEPSAATPAARKRKTRR